MLSYQTEWFILKTVCLSRSYRYATLRYYCKSTYMICDMHANHVLACMKWIYLRFHMASHRITSHHITSHRITSHHIASHHIASHHIASHRIASHHITSHDITSHDIMSYQIVWFIVISYYEIWGVTVDGDRARHRWSWYRIGFCNIRPHTYPIIPSPPCDISSYDAIPRVLQMSVYLIGASTCLIDVIATSNVLSFSWVSLTIARMELKFNCLIT